RCEVYCSAPAWPIIAAVREGSRDAVAAFFHRRVRKSDNDNDRIAARAIYLDFDFVRVHAVNGGGINFRQHRSGRVAENRCAAKRQMSLEATNALKMLSNLKRCVGKPWI